MKRTQLLLVLVCATWLLPPTHANPLPLEPVVPGIDPPVLTTVSSDVSNCPAITITAWVSWPGTTVWSQATFQCGQVVSGGGNCYDTRSDTIYEECDKDTTWTIWSAFAGGYDVGAATSVSYVDGQPTCSAQSYGPHPAGNPTKNCQGYDNNSKQEVEVKKNTG